MKALIIHSKNFCIKMKTNILRMKVWPASTPGEVNGMPGSNNTGRELGLFLKNRFIYLKIIIDFFHYCKDRFTSKLFWSK